jgi:UPF0042 nucleotide-binding protein
LRHGLKGYAEAYVALSERGDVLEVVYLDARDDILVRRFSQTRRRHPLDGEDLLAGLDRERALLAPLRAQASSCIDTSDLTVHQLKSVIEQRYEENQDGLVISMLSFGFRYGIPAQADLVLDVRFLQNPYFVEHLRDRTGQERPVADFVLAQPDAREFLDRTSAWLRFLLPRFEAEGKVYLTVAIGCTGGRHRSVALAEALAAGLSDTHPIRLAHRDVLR